MRQFNLVPLTSMAAQIGLPISGARSAQMDPALVREHRRLQRRMLALLALAALAVGLYLTIDVNDWAFALPRRFRKVMAMIVVGTAIAYSTVLFQTITNNRILTPSIIGFDALYVLIQTVIAFFFGTAVLISVNPITLFLINVLIMIVAAGALYRWLFDREGAHLYFMMLVGVIFGVLFTNLSNFMQKMLDPNEFSVLQTRLFASISNVNQDLLLISLIGVVGAILYSLRFVRLADVTGLGRDAAVNLGIDHKIVVNRIMIVIALLVSISTALVGPITFLGLLVANVTYQYMQSWRHSYILPGAVLMSIVGLVGCQVLLEHVFQYSTPLSVIFNFIGGIYFLYLLLRKAGAT